MVGGAAIARTEWDDCWPAAPSAIVWGMKVFDPNSAWSKVAAP
jgi:hypothetical protein